MSTYDHEALDVHQAAIECVGLSDDIVEHLPRGRAYRLAAVPVATYSIESH